MIKQESSKEQIKEVNNWSYIRYKRLEELFAWAYFYNVNKHPGKLEKVQIEIEELRKELFNK